MKRTGKYFELPKSVCREIARRSKLLVCPEWKVVSDAIEAMKTGYADNPIVSFFGGARTGKRRAKK